MIYIQTTIMIIFLLGCVYESVGSIKSLKNPMLSDKAKGKKKLSRSEKTEIKKDAILVLSANVFFGFGSVLFLLNSILNIGVWYG